MKIFGLGLSKTGTSSLNKALTILGYKSIHCPLDQTTYEEIAIGKFPLSLNFDALTDITTIPCYRQLDKHYSGSKFILTIRNKSEWLVSIKNHIEKSLLRGKWLEKVNSYLRGESLDLGTPERQFFKVAVFLHTSVYGCLGYSEEKFSQIFDDHNESIDCYFKDNLLIMDICAGDGWNMLCPFLNKPIPQVKFPHENSSSSVSPK